MFSPLPPTSPPEKLAPYCPKILPLKVTRTAGCSWLCNQIKPMMQITWGKKKKNIMKSKEPLFYYQNVCFLYQEDWITYTCGHMPTVARRNPKRKWSFVCWSACTVKSRGKKITQMEKMIKEGAAFQEPQLLTAVPVTVYVGHFVSWPSWLRYIIMLFDNLKIRFYFLSRTLVIPCLIRKKNVECFDW